MSSAKLVCRPSEAITQAGKSLVGSTCCRAELLERDKRLNGWKYAAGNEGAHVKAGVWSWSGRAGSSRNVGCSNRGGAYLFRHPSLATAVALISDISLRGCFGVQCQ